MKLKLCKQKIIKRKIVSKIMKNTFHRETRIIMDLLELNCFKIFNIKKKKISIKCFILFFLFRVIV